MHLKFLNQIKIDIKMNLKPNFVRYKQSERALLTAIGLLIVFYTSLILKPRIERISTVLKSNANYNVDKNHTMDDKSSPAPTSSEKILNFSVFLNSLIFFHVIFS